MAAVLTMLLAAGCSMPRLAYQQADWLLLREMDSYLDLGDTQRERVEGALRISLRRHRIEHLPAVASTFTEAARRARGGLARDDVRWIYQQGRILLADTAGLLLPTLATTLVELSPQQRRHLARRMQERNEEFIERHGLDVGLDERKERQATRAVNRIEQWTGTLSEAQAALVREARVKMPDLSAAWLAYTRERQKALLRLLDTGSTPDEVKAFLEGWWLHQEGMPREMERQRDMVIEAYIGLVARLDATLDSVQREHLVDALEDLADDAASLVREA